MHDPARLHALGRATLVEDERLLDADHGGAAAAVGTRAGSGGGERDGLVGAGGLPVAGAGGAVGADAVGVLAVSRAEEVPLRLPENCLGCMKQKWQEEYIE